MNFDKELGLKIREIRKLRGYSLQALSDQIMVRFNLEYSGNLISMWERGERKLSASQLNILCKVLGCTPNLLYPGFEGTPSERIAQEYAALSPHEQHILEYAALFWDGNTHALIEFAALYMSLPRRLREDIAFMGITTFEKGEREGVINEEVPKADISYIEAQWKHLLRKE